MIKNVALIKNLFFCWPKFDILILSISADFLGERYVSTVVMTTCLGMANIMAGRGTFTSPVERLLLISPSPHHCSKKELSKRITYAKCEQSSKMYIFSPQSVHYVALTISNGFSVLQSVAAARHIKYFTAMNQTVQYGSGNRCIT